MVYFLPFSRLELLKLVTKELESWSQLVSAPTSLPASFDPGCHVLLSLEASCACALSSLRVCPKPKDCVMTLPTGDKASRHPHHVGQRSPGHAGGRL